MSLVFNDTSTLRGIVQIAEREMGVEQGYISNDSTRLKQFVADVNLAWDEYIYLAFTANDEWQWDDSNHTDYPIIYANIVSGQQDYPFTIDANSNLILDIYKVLILPNASSTQYDEISPTDQQKREIVHNDLAEEVGTTGTPWRYDKTANSIFLDPTPNYNATNGLKVYINREPSYFTTSDTTKKPGCPGIHHRYFAIKPAFDYARRNQLSNYNLLREEVVSYEGDEEKGVVGSITRYYTRRSKDSTTSLLPERLTYE